jgi:hypothetical protein
MRGNTMNGRNKSKSSSSHRRPRIDRSENRAAWRLWAVVFPGRDAGEVAAVLITNSAIAPLPIAFISNFGIDAIQIGMKILRGRAALDGEADFRGSNLYAVADRLSGALLYPIDPIDGGHDNGVDHLDAARISIDPTTEAVSFITLDSRGLAAFLGIAPFSTGLIPRALRREAMGLRQTARQTENTATSSGNEGASKKQERKLHDEIS